MTHLASLTDAALQTAHLKAVADGDNALADAAWEIFVSRHTLNERGYRVPDDVSVTGVDDTPEAAFYSPPLTTLRLDFTTGGRDVVQQLLALIDGVEPPPLPRRRSELIVRRSTGPVRLRE